MEVDSNCAFGVGSSLVLDVVRNVYQNVSDKLSAARVKAAREDLRKPLPKLDVEQVVDALPSPSVGKGQQTKEPAGHSSLRRVKQLDASVVKAIESSCAITPHEVFRIIQENAGSAISQQTKVLLVMAGDAHLCEESISEEGATEQSALPAGDADGDAGCEATFCGDSACASDISIDAVGGSVEVELFFFRAKPRLGQLAKKLGTVPVLHVTVLTSDGVSQSLEFLGVHQRRYFTEATPSDAISQHLSESLLRVALEFVFHPSRSKYAKPRLVLRECSVLPEVLRDRKDALPHMAQILQQLNGDIKQVILEYGPPRGRLRAAASRKSCLALDERCLNVAPEAAKVASAPPAKASFEGLGKGFLSASKTKARGLGDRRTEKDASQFQGSASFSSASTSAAQAMQTSASSFGPSEHYASAGSSSAGPGPPPVTTNRQERGKLLLSAADVSSCMPEEAKAVSAQTGDVAPEEEDEEEPEEGQGPSISELADQLFGDGGGLDIDIDDAMWEGDQSESTKTPSPKASSLGAVASERSRPPSELSEAVTEDISACGDDTGTVTLRSPSSGTPTRLLQQRKLEREAATKDEKDDGDELVQRWLNQRW